MALIGFAGANSYTVIAPAIDRHSMFVYISLKTFSDSTKTNLLFMHQLTVNPNTETSIELAGIVDGDMPSNPSDEQRFFVKSVTDQQYASYVGKIITWGNSTWRYDNRDISRLFRLAGQTQMFVINADLTTSNVDYMYQSDFDSWFSVAAISGTSNFIKQCYEYLKSRPEYSHCTDG
jgi:hypothetical protein